MAKFHKHFRKLNNKKGQGHPSYIYEEEGRDYRFVGITHAELTDGNPNIPLKKNPDPADKRKAFARPRPDKAQKSGFGKRLDKWRLSKCDTEAVEDTIKKSRK